MDDNEQLKDRGRVRFLTITGSRYDIDLDAGLLQRTTGTPVDPEWPSAELRHDNEVIDLLEVYGDFVIGTEVQLVIQLPGRPFVTVRRPTTMVEVEWLREPHPQKPPAPERDT